MNRQGASESLSVRIAGAAFKHWTEDVRASGSSPALASAMALRRLDEILLEGPSEYVVALKGMIREWAEVMACAVEGEVPGSQSGEVDA